MRIWNIDLNSYTERNAMQQTSTENDIKDTYET